jgi:hypothetical protein
MVTVFHAKILIKIFDFPLCPITASSDTVEPERRQISVLNKVHQKYKI